MEKILLFGFWGRGNCGDEAMLQCQYEFFRDRFEVGLVLDMYGYYERFWEWYPYNVCSSLHHQVSIDHLLSGDVKAIHFGGGGLSVGYGAHQVIKAKKFGIKSLLTGVDIHLAHSSIDNEVHSLYYSLFDYIAVRNLTPPNVPYNHLIDLGADWAFDLETDNSEAIIDDNKRVLLVIREFNYTLITDDYIKLLNLHLDILKYAGYRPILVPFCHHDTDFIRHIGLDKYAPIIELWHNPKMMQQYFANSAMILSYGRFHPLIFAANVKKPIALINYFPLIGREIDFKSNSMALALEVPIITNKSEFSEFILNPVTPSESKTALAKERLALMKSSILQCIDGY